STNSSCETLRKSLIGNTDWNTACKPPSSRSLGSLSICRKRSYERLCTSIRFGIWMVVGIVEKLRRLRNAYRLLFGITPPEGALTAPGTPGGYSIPFARIGRHYLRHSRAMKK